MQTPENESCLTYQMRHASQGLECQLERREEKRKIRYGRDDFDLLRNLGQINH